MRTTRFLTYVAGAMSGRGVGTHPPPSPAKALPSLNFLIF